MHKENPYAIDLGDNISFVGDMMGKPRILSSGETNIVNRQPKSTPEVKMNK